MRQYRCIRKHDHFLPILCTYVRDLSPRCSNLSIAKNRAQSGIFMAKKKQDRSTYGMIDLNKLDKEKQPVMSNILKPTVFASSKIKIELQEGYVSD